MTVASLTIVDKIDTVLASDGFFKHDNDSEMTGVAIWSRSHAEKSGQIYVALSTEGAPFVLVSLLDVDGPVSSSKFYVGAENVWGFFENTLKLAIKSI